MIASSQPDEEHARRRARRPPASAPATISPGARSPPIASTATVMGTAHRRYSTSIDLAAAVPAAVAAHDVRQLHRAAVRAHRAGGGVETPVRRAALTRLRLAGSCAWGRPSGAPVPSCDFRARARRARPTGDRRGVAGCVGVGGDEVVRRRSGRRGRTPAARAVVARAAPAAARAARCRARAARGRSRDRRSDRSRLRRGCGSNSSSTPTVEVGRELAAGTAALALPAGRDSSPRTTMPSGTRSSTRSSRDRFGDAGDRRAEALDRDLRWTGRRAPGCVRRSATSMRSALMGPAWQRGGQG